MPALRRFLVGPALFALTFGSLIAGESPEVELLEDAEWLQPGSTFEFRFARPMISPENLGPVGGAGPLVISPEMPGDFTWLSSRSGVFVPQGPLPLGVNYQIHLAKDLKAVDGKPIGRGLTWSVKTPPFQVTQLMTNVDDPSSVPPFVQIRLAFNLPVQLPTAQQIQFLNAAGESIPAEVRFANSRDYFPLQAEDDDWNARWSGTTAAIAPEVDGDEDPGEVMDWPNRLIISPAKPLTPGSAWRLDIKAGLRAVAGEAQTEPKTEPFEVALGTVQPFTILRLDTTNYLNGGKSLLVEFSNTPAPDITEGTAARFFAISPEVPDLKFEPGWRNVLISGAFALGQDYTLTVGEEVVSADGLILAGDRKKTFKFEPVAPRVYLPEITGQQFAEGTRRFEILSVNLQSLRVRAIKVAPEAAAQAVAAFSQYNKEWDADAEGEIFQALPPEAIVGRDLSNKTIAPGVTTLDTRQETTLDWTEILGGADKPGVVFLTVEGQPLPGVPGAHRQPAAQALMQITDLGVLWKKPEGDLQVTIFSMANGDPVAGASVVLLDADFKTLAKGTSAAEGKLALAVGAVPAWLVVSKGNDVNVLKMGPSGSELPGTAFGVPVFYRSWDPAPEQPTLLRAVLFSDRPLYQPGETVKIKGYLRELGVGGLNLPAAGTVAKLSLLSPRWDTLGTWEISTDATGAFATEIPLEAGALGRYRLQLEVPGGMFPWWSESPAATFEVTNYQPDAFEVKVDLPRTLPDPKQAVQADVTAAYFFGGALSRADLRWTLRYTPTLFAPAGFERFLFLGMEEGRSGTLTLRGEGQLEGKAPWVIAPQLPLPEERPFLGQLTVEVTDLNQQSVSRTVDFRREASQFYLGIAAPDYSVSRAGSPVRVPVVAVSPDGKPLPSPVDFSATLIRLRQETVRLQGAGTAISFRTETIEEPIANLSAQTLLPALENGQWTVNPEQGVVFTPPSAGLYAIEVQAKDGLGAPVRSRSTFYVSGPGQLSWDYRHPSQVDLVPDKASYLPGETAKILIKTPIEGEAMVSIERGAEVLRTLRVRLEGNAPTIRVPLEATDAPNVFVSLMLLRGADESKRKYPMPEFRYGICLLKVENAASQLRVSLAPKNPTAQPGEKIQTEILVQNDLGQPVPRAGVTFFAVDDGILSLTGYDRPQPGETFGQAFPLQVRTGLSLDELMPDDPADLDFGNKGYLIGGGGREGALKLRENFPGTACWLPDLTTDAEGKVQVEFTAPDALTRYRLVAVAAAGTDAFGSGESAVSIAKPLMLLPSLGQFANEGDELRARVVVRNNSGKAGEVTVSLQLSGAAELQGEAGQTISLPAGEARALDFAVRFTNTGDSRWEWTARMTAGGETYTDAVVSQLPVGSPMVVLRETHLPNLPPGATDLLKDINPQLSEGRGEVSVSVANSRLAALQESATYLLEYPYGCAEQTVSALIPWIVAPEFGPLLPGLQKPEAETTRVINEAVDKLFAQQTGSGGLSFWPGGSEPSLFASSWAAVAFSRLAERGISLPPGWPNLLKYLSESLRGLDTPAGLRGAGRLDEMTFVCYALSLAGKAEPAYHEILFARRADLTRGSRALLALAVLNAGGDAGMAATLLNPKNRAPDDYSVFGSGVREQAIQLLAWVNHAPTDKEVPRLVAELLQARRNGRWSNTQENAWALLALADYHARVEQSGPKKSRPVLVTADGTIQNNGESVAFAVNPSTPVQTHSFAWDSTGTNGTLQVNNDSKSPLYGETRFVVVPPLGLQPRQERGFSLTRTYQKMADDGSLGAMADLRVGDRIVVTLRLEAVRPAHFVVIDDPLPAILEAVNPAFVSRAVGGPVPASPAASHQEMRGDRVVYFCDALPAGTFVFQYLSRVRAAGEVMAPAAKAEEMYRPERFGLTDTQKLSSQSATP